MTAAIEGSRSARVRAEVARMDIRPGRMVLTVLAGSLWAVGWVARKAVLVLAYGVVAVRVGWADAGPNNKGD